MTAQTTIEALMYELRQGVGMLAEDGARGRLAACNKAALRQIASRLQRGHGHDPHWSESDVSTLILEWQKLKGKR